VRAGSDGPDATGAFFLGGRSVVPQIEPLEARFPLRFLHARLIEDSGGPGTWRGGRGTEIAVELLAPAELTVRGTRIDIPPAGRDGGRPGRAGGYRVERRDGTSLTLAPKQAKQRLEAGDVFLMRTSGGGGLGPPPQRDPQRVLEDVRARRVSRAGAASDYGVVLDASGSRVDAEATARRREQARAEAAGP
jgi:N-methylhydantoinase B